MSVLNEIIRVVTTSALRIELVVRSLYLVTRETNLANWLLARCSERKKCGCSLMRSGATKVQEGSSCRRDQVARGTRCMRDQGAGGTTRLRGLQKVPHISLQLRLFLRRCGNRGREQQPRTSDLTESV